MDISTNLRMQVHIVEHAFTLGNGRVMYVWTDAPIGSTAVHLKEALNTGERISNSFYLSSELGCAGNESLYQNDYGDEEE